MYLFSVTHDDVINILGSTKGRQAFFDRVLVANVQKASLGLSKEPRVVLNGISLSWCVDHAEHFLEVCLQELVPQISQNCLLDVWECPLADLVVQNFVLCLHTSHESILG